MSKTSTCRASGATSGAQEITASRASSSGPDHLEPEPGLAAPRARGSGCRCAPAGRPRSPPAARSAPGSARASRRRSRAPPASARCAPRDRWPVRSSPEPRRTDLAKASTTRNCPRVRRRDQHPAAVRAQVESRVQFRLRRRAARAPRRLGANATLSCADPVKSCAMQLPIRILRRSPQVWRERYMTPAGKATAPPGRGRRCGKHAPVVVRRHVVATWRPAARYVNNRLKPARDRPTGRETSTKEPSMTPWTRRSFLAAAGCGLAACTSTPPASRRDAARTASTATSTPPWPSSTRTSPAPASSAPARRASW